MGLRKLVLPLALYVTLIYCSTGSDSDSDLSPNVKVAVSVSDVFGFNNNIKKITEMLQNQRKLESTLSQFEVSDLTSNKTNASLLLYAVFQSYNDLKQKYIDLETRLSKRGTTYIRWGRKQCDPNDTELVYSGKSYNRQYIQWNPIINVTSITWKYTNLNACQRSPDKKYFYSLYILPSTSQPDTSIKDTHYLPFAGYAGGSKHEHTGAAADYVCLPTDKLNFSSANYGKYANFMYGAEYEFPDSSLFDHDVPCAVCRSTKYSTAVMIPARSQCYDGWQVIYRGDLMSGKYDHPAASSFVCLDSDPEVVSGGVENLNGKLFYPVEAQCGSLKCPPYVNGKRLTCVLCGK